MVEFFSPEFLSDLITLIVLGFFLVSILILLRLTLKLTMTLFRLGCFIIVLLLGAVGVWLFFLS